jgi:hypothetical protein
VLVAECAEQRAQRLGARFGQQVRELVTFVVTRTDFLEAPASCRYHMSIPSGLLLHSVLVAETAVRLRNLMMPAVAYDSVVLCSVFHDVGKVWSHTRRDGTLAPRYESSGKGSEDRYQIAEGDNGIDQTIKNLLLVHRFVELSDAETQCLFYSDGPHVPGSRSANHRQHPLSLLVAFSDEWCGRIIENDVPADWLSGMVAGRS